MKRMNPAILALAETRLTVEIEDNEVNVPGYSIVRCDSRCESRYTGGVLVYVRNDIKYKVVEIKKIESNCWCVALEVRESM